MYLQRGERVTHSSNPKLYGEVVHPSEGGFSARVGYACVAWDRLPRGGKADTVTMEAISSLHSMTKRPKAGLTYDKDYEKLTGRHKNAAGQWVNTPGYKSSDYFEAAYCGICKGPHKHKHGRR